MLNNKNHSIQRISPANAHKIFLLIQNLYNSIAAKIPNK